MTTEPTQSPDTAGEEGCPRCGRPTDICVCDRTVQVPTKRRVLVLQHPREKDVELGSASLAAMSLPSSKLVVGLSWRSLSQVLGAEVDPSRWAVVFPGRLPGGASAAHEKPAELDAQTEADRRAADRATARALAPGEHLLVDAKGEPESARRIQGIVVLDGSWSQAKSLWWRNAWLLKLARLTLSPKEPSIYGSLRPEPRREYVSTLEATGAALTALGEDPEVEAQLRKVFRTLVQRARDRYRTRGRTADGGRAARLKRRRRARSARRGPPSVR